MLFPLRSFTWTVSLECFASYQPKSRSASAPSDSSGSPNVNRYTEVTCSWPIVPQPSPIASGNRLLIRLPPEIRDSCQAYLVVALENRTSTRLDEDIETAGALLTDLGAVDAYVLEGGSARKLI